MYLFLLAEVKSYLQNVVRDLPQKVARSTTVKREVTLKHLLQAQKQKKTKRGKNLFVRVVKVGQENGAKLQDVVGSVKMEQNKPFILFLASVLVVGTVASFGLVIQKWTEWTTSTLISLDKQQAVIEQKIETTNALIAQNHEMLKSIIRDQSKKAFFKVQNE